MGGSIPFDVANINVGNAMDISTGIFTAPVKGTYFFAFSGNAYLNPPPYEHTYLYVKLSHNGNNVGQTMTEIYDTDGYHTLSLDIMLNMEAGDQVWLEMPIAKNAHLSDGEHHTNHFVGWLVEEDISPSFSFEQ